MVLCGVRSWTWWPFGVHSNLRYSEVILWSSMASQPWGSPEQYLLPEHLPLWQERGRNCWDTACGLYLAGSKVDCIVLVLLGCWGMDCSTVFSLPSWLIWLLWSVANCRRCSEQWCQLSLWLRSMPRMLQQSWSRRMWRAWMISSGSPSSGRELSCRTSPGLPGQSLFSSPISHVWDKWEQEFAWSVSSICEAPLTSLWKVGLQSPVDASSKASETDLDTSAIETVLYHRVSNASV